MKTNPEALTLPAAANLCTACAVPYCEPTLSDAHAYLQDLISREGGEAQVSNELVQVLQSFEGMFKAEMGGAGFQRKMTHPLWKGKMTMFPESKSSETWTLGVDKGARYVRYVLLVMDHWLFKNTNSERTGEVTEVELLDGGRANKTPGKHTVKVLCSDVLRSGNRVNVGVAGLIVTLQVGDDGAVDDIALVEGGHHYKIDDVVLVRKSCIGGAVADVFFKVSSVNPFSVASERYVAAVTRC